MSFLSRSRVAVWIARHLVPSGLAFCAALVLLGYAFVFRAQIAAIGYADQVAALGERQKSEQAYLDQLDELGSQYASFDQGDVERIRAMIPTEEDIPSILAMLEASASAADLQLSAVNFGAGDTTGLPGVSGLSALNVSISLQHGSYERFKLFLDSLQTNLRLFDVRSANVNPQNASYSLTIRTYVWGKLSG